MLETAGRQRQEHTRYRLNNSIRLELCVDSTTCSRLCRAFVGVAAVVIQITTTWVVQPIRSFSGFRLGGDDTPVFAEPLLSAQIIHPTPGQFEESSRNGNPERVIIWQSHTTCASSVLWVLFSPGAVLRMTVKAIRGCHPPTKTTDRRIRIQHPPLERLFFPRRVVGV